MAIDILKLFELLLQSMLLCQNYKDKIYIIMLFCKYVEYNSFV